MANTATLMVRILGDASSAQKAFGQATGRMDRFKSVAAKVGAGVAIAGAGLAILAKRSVTAAANLEQSEGAIDSIFKGSAGQMHKWAKNASTSVGLTANEFNELGSLIGAQLKNGGTAMDKLGPKTSQLITLGADLSSMFGGSTREAVEALSSALKGERDPIERYGVSLNQAKVDAEAAALGFKKVGGSLSSEASQAATLSLIMKQTADAHGNFARETVTLAHQGQVMNAQFGNLQSTIGTALTPALATMATQVTSNVLPPLQALAEKYAPMVGKALGDLAVAVGPKINAFLKDLPAALNGIGKGDTGANVSSIAASLKELGPAVSGASSALPSFGDLLSVTAVVLKVAADHTDTLVKALPLLAIGYAGVKAAQLAANVAAVASVPTKIAEVVVNRQLVRSNQALIASRAGLTTATVTGTAAESAGLLTRARATAGMVAQRVAMVAVSAATKAWAAAQWLLNIAMTANPIGLVIAAVILLVAAIVILWKRSETFRSIVLGAWAAIRVGTVVIFNFLKGFILKIWDGIRTYFTVMFAIYRTIFTVSWRAIRAVTVAVFSGVRAFIQKVLAGLRAYFTTVLGVYRAVFTRAWSFIKTITRAAFNAAKTYVISPMNAALAFIRSIPGKVTSGLSRLSGAARGAFSGAFNSAKSTATGILNSFITFVRGIPGKAADALSSLGSRLRSIITGIDLYSAGAALISGLTSGISSKIESAVSAVRDGAKRIKDLWPGSPVKSGPLTAWNNGRAGKRLMELLASGIEKGAAEVERAAALAAYGINGGLSIAATAAGSPQVNLSVPSSGPTIVEVHLDGQVIGRYVQKKVDASIGSQARRIVLGAVS